MKTKLAFTIILLPILLLGCRKKEEPELYSKYAQISYARLPSLTHIEGAFETRDLISAHNHKAVWRYRCEIGADSIMQMYEIYPKSEKRLIGHPFKVELRNRELVIKDALMVPPFSITDEMPPAMLFITEDEFVGKVLNTDITYIFRRVK